jgi:hypothetical protein
LGERLEAEDFLCRYGVNVKVNLQQAAVSLRGLKELLSCRYTERGRNTVRSGGSGRGW